MLSETTDEGCHPTANSYLEDSKLDFDVRSDFLEGRRKPILDDFLYFLEKGRFKLKELGGDRNNQGEVETKKVDRLATKMCDEDDDDDDGRYDVFVRTTTKKLATFRTREEAEAFAEKHFKNPKYFYLRNQYFIEPHIKGIKPMSPLEWSNQKRRNDNKRRCWKQTNQPSAYGNKFKFEHGSALSDIDPLVLVSWWT